MKRSLLTGLSVAVVMTVASPCFSQGFFGEGASGDEGTATGGRGDAAQSEVGGGGRAAAGPGGEGGVPGIAAPSPVYGIELKFDAPIDTQGLPTSLDEAIQRALANNPDIRVAEANLRQAQAAFEQAKLKLTHQVMIALEQAEVDRIALKRIQHAVNAVANSVPQQEQHLARFAARKSQLELKYLLGDAPAGAGMMGTGMPGGMMGMGGAAGLSGNVSGFDFNQIGGAGSMSAGLSGYTQMGSSTGAAAGGADAGGGPAGVGGGVDAIPHAPEASRRKWYEETLSKACGPIDLKAGAAEALAEALSQLMEVPVIVDSRALIERSEDPIQVKLTLDHAGLTWRGVLTAIADTHDIAFVIRDYGILVTTPEKANAASGAVFGGGMGGGGGGFGGGGFGGGGGAIGGRSGGGGAF